MRKEFDANQALAATILPRAKDWTTPSRSAKNHNAKRIERSHRMADLAIVVLFVVSVAGLIVGCFG